MDTRAKLFEGVLTEFNWGQLLSQHRITNLKDYNPTVHSIDTEDKINAHISVYLNWCGGVAHHDKANNTKHFSSPDVLTKRNTIVNAILARLAREKPKHPSLIVLAKDWEKELLEQQRTCIRFKKLSPYRSVPPKS